MEVCDCEVLEHVFDLQELDKNVVILPKLETLELRGLPRLRYIICNEDKNDSMGCLFSHSTLMDFQNLKHLSIEDCLKENEDIMLFYEKVSFLPYIFYFIFSYTILGNIDKNILLK